MIRGMYKGMKISIKVIVDGKIVNTNATYKNRNVVTLSDIDFDVIMENEKALQILAGNENASEEVMKKSMQKFPGFKTDLNDKIVIKFK
jgi:UDP-N-acetylglucosamine enolpyruvyl transferase